MFRLLHGLVPPTGLCNELYLVKCKWDRERFMPGLTVSAHPWRDRSGETESNVWNRFCMKLPYVAQQVGNAYFYRLTGIKELSGHLWWMHEVKSLLRPITECGLFWHVESYVTKISGSSHDHGFVLFLFATMGFHTTWSGIFWTPTFVL